MIVYVVHVCPATDCSFILGVYPSLEKAEEENDRIVTRLPCNIIKFEVETLEPEASKTKKATDLIEEFGGIDGAHHKQWLLDQVVRVLADAYKEWVIDYENGEDGTESYSWDTGIAP